MIELVLNALAETFATVDEEDLGGLKGPRARAAAEFWKDNWWRMVSNPGHGEYILQAHWRGLTEDVKDRDHEWLYQHTRHSVHEDLRHEASETWAGEPSVARLFGFAAFVNVEDMRKTGGGVLPTLGTNRSPQSAIQVAWKLPQPVTWLTLGRRKPFIAPPKEAGATSRKFAKLFALDWGTYRVGVCREHSFEIFYDSEKGGLKGRHIISLARIKGRTAWLIRKPEDQTPLAERENPERLLRELKRKKQKYLVWGRGDRSQPVVYNVSTGRKIVTKAFPVQIVKRVMRKGLVYGEVLVPGEEDAQGQFATAEEIQEAAHKYLMRSGRLDYRHQRLLGDDEAALVESFLAPVTFEWEGRTISEGTWIICVKIFDEILKKEIETGELNSFSIRGFAELI